jgi:hypothetical protein
MLSSRWLAVGSGSHGTANPRSNFWRILAERGPDETAHAKLLAALATTKAAVAPRNSCRESALHTILVAAFKRRVETSRETLPQLTTPSETENCQIATINIEILTLVNKL